MKRMYVLLIVSTVAIVLISAFSNNYKDNSELIFGPCTQRICAIDTGTTYLSGILINIDSAGTTVNSCTTDSSGCCNVVLQEGGQYTAYAPAYDSSTPVTFTACLPKPIRIIIR